MPHPQATCAAPAVTPLDAPSAWALIRSLCRHAHHPGTPVDRVNRGDPHSTPDTAMHALRIGTDGGWSADGIVAPEAALLLDTLLPLVCHSGPLVIAQIGQSLDGRTATASGHSCYVTGYASRVHLHRLRALVDAVIVGANTATEDNPQLTVRHIPGDSPARVILDPNGRVPHDSTVFTDDGPPTWHAVRAGVAAAPGANRLELPDADADIPASLLAELAARGMPRVLVEGGGITISHFMAAGCIHRLHVVVAPFLIGSGRPCLRLPEIETLDQAIRPPCRSFALGEDRLYDLALAAAPAGSPSTSW